MLTSSENISRKSLIQSLQDQIAVLQVELLEVRQQNAVLQRSMKAMQDGQERLRDGVRPRLGSSNVRHLYKPLII